MNPFFAAWEAEYEAAGPIIEADRAIPSPKARVPEYPYIPEARAVWEGKRRILDMGGELSNGRTVPGARVWTQSLGCDMRDVSSLSRASFDLIFCSHAIEHVPAEDVPKMLRDWLELLEPGGELFILAPHRRSPEWSPLLRPEAADLHLWAPACATVGNYLASLGMEIVDYDTCIPELHIWYLRARKP